MFNKDKTFIEIASPMAIKIELFDWTSPDRETSIRFAVTSLSYAMANGQVPFEHVTTALDSEFARIWLPQRELNKDLCANMTKRRRDEPVLGAWMPDGTVLLIDGSHRYMARYLHHEETIDYYLVKYADWKPFATLLKGEWP